MKKTIITLAIILMAVPALAHDPNSLPPNEELQWSVNNENIVTFDVRLSPRLVKILSRLSNYEVKTTVIKMVLSWEPIVRRNWMRNKKTEEMD